MPRLPNITDLGPTPTADPGRAVASYDVSGIARGAEALTQAGQRFGAGVQQAGEGAAEYDLDKARWQYSAAKQAQAAALLAAHASLQGDNVYGPDDGGQTMQDRYADRAANINQQAAQTIENPQMRQRFENETVPQVQQLNDAALTRARSLGINASVASYRQNGDAIIDTANNNVLDDGLKANAIDAQNQAVDGLVTMGAFTPEQALAEKRGFAQKFAMANGVALADNGAPEQVKRDLGRTPGSPDAIADVIIKNESGGNPLARSSTSNAMGAGQFEPATWLSLIKANRPDLAQGRSDAELLDMRADPNLSRDMVKVNNAQNSAYLKAKGLDATPGAQYLAHVLGPASAAAVLQADPKAPVADVLSKAVGDDQAKKMIAANPSILGGQLAGSVAQWADTKMGAASQGHPYDMLDTAQREELWRHADTVEQKQKVGERADFQTRVANATAEAFDTGQPSQPLTRSDFIAEFGADRGSVEFGKYDANVQSGRAVAGLATMTPQEREATVSSLYPKPGDPNYATKTQAYEVADKSLSRINLALYGDKTHPADPAGFATQRLPASTEAYSAFTSALGNPQASPADKATAAQAYAARTLLDQQHAGIAPDDARIVPNSYVASINKTIMAAANSDDAQKRVSLIGQIQQERSMWGPNYWPQIMRQLAPSAQPIVRAIAADADPTAMTRLLSLGKDEKPAELLKQQSETKAADLTKAVDTAMTPFLSTLVGRQRDRDYTGYYNLATQLGALYVRDGQSASDAAGKAFNDLVGKNYDFRDSYRIPRSSGASPDDVQAGALAARSQLADLGARAPANTLPGVDSQDDLANVARDGRWVTAPGNDGLNLAYGDKFLRDAAGEPFKLPWDQLAKLGAGRTAAQNAPPAGTRREFLARQGVDQQPAARVMPPGGAAAAPPSAVE